MDTNEKDRLREFLQTCLAERGDHAAIRDNESIFISGRLDSLAMTRMVVYLEQAFKIDFGKVNFEVDLIDSVQSIEQLVEAER